MMDVKEMEELADNYTRIEEWINFLRLIDPVVASALDLAESRNMRKEQAYALVVCCMGYHKQKVQNENSSNRSSSIPLK